MGFKYIFSKNPYIANFGYGKSFKKQFNDIFVFENEYTLPIVFGYNKVISYEEFNKLTMYEKQKALMKCCVVPNDSIKNFEKKQILKADDLKIDMSQYMSYKNKSFHKADSIYSTDEVFRESTILIKVEFDLDEPEYRAKLNYNYKNGFNSSYFIRLDEDDNFYYYEINGQYVSSIWFSDYSGNIIDPKRCEFYVIPWSEYYKDYINSYNHIKQNIVKVDHFSGYSVDGRIDMLDDGVLYFAAPYDDWKLYVDGKETEIVKTNIGFMGAKISKGYHKFKFVYENGTGISMDEMIKIIVLSSSFIWIFICNIVVEIKNKIIRKKDEKNEE